MTWHEKSEANTSLADGCTVSGHRTYSLLFILHCKQSDVLRQLIYAELGIVNPSSIRKTLVYLEGSEYQDSRSFKIQLSYKCGSQESNL